MCPSVLDSAALRVPIWNMKGRTVFDADCSSKGCRFSTGVISDDDVCGCVDVFRGSVFLSQILGLY
jgi:hypothetical protein